MFSKVENLDMNWYRSILAQSDMNAQDAYINYGHESTHLPAGKELPEEVSNDEMWIWSQGQFQRRRAADFYSGDSMLDKEMGTHYLFTHDNVWPEIDEGRHERHLNFWKGRYDSQKNIVTVLGPLEWAQRDIPGPLMRNLMSAYPSAQIRRFQ